MQARRYTIKSSSTTSTAPTSCRMFFKSRMMVCTRIRMLLAKDISVRAWCIDRCWRPCPVAASFLDKPMRPLLYVARFISFQRVLAPLHLSLSLARARFRRRCSAQRLFVGRTAVCNVHERSRGNGSKFLTWEGWGTPCVHVRSNDKVCWLWSLAGSLIMSLQG